MRTTLAIVRPRCVLAAAPVLGTPRVFGRVRRRPAAQAKARSRNGK